jgi:hypothetical protein
MKPFDALVEDLKKDGIRIELPKIGYQCEAKGCEYDAIDGSDYCEDHQEECAHAHTKLVRGGYLCRECGSIGTHTDENGRDK